MSELGTEGGTGREEEEGSFEDLLEESLARSRVRLNPGERVRGTVIALRRREAVVDLGSKREAFLDLAESQAEPLSSVHVGDEVEGTLIDEGDEGEPARMTRLVPGGRLGRQYLARVRSDGGTVTGVVRGYNRGGLEIQIGNLRAFCPMSQIDARPPEDLSRLVGQQLSFKVHDLRGSQVVVSRRAVLDEERAAQALETLGKLTEGTELRGRVASVHDFGAFIDIWGVDALLPTSEVTRRRIGRVAEVLAPGQEVAVRVLRVDLGDGKRRPRVTVSMKALEPDPWEAARSWLVPGAAFRGTVVGIQPFGAFVELVAGVDGLIHVTDLAGGARVRHPEELLRVGQELDVLIGSVDWESRRISLSPLVPLAGPPPEHPEEPSPDEGFGAIGDRLKEKESRNGHG
jgi:small subunit ribosomal protein S1